MQHIGTPRTPDTLAHLGTPFLPAVAVLVQCHAAHAYGTMWVQHYLRFEHAISPGRATSTHFLKNDFGVSHQARYYKYAFFRSTDGNTAAHFF